MRSEENNRKYLNEVWRRVRVQEYDRYQLDKIKENKKFLRMIEIKLSLSIFGGLSFLSLILYFILGVSMEWLIICISAFLIGAEIYDYLSFNEAKRRIYYENSN
ncbi:hypothetical protein CIW83_04665 [Tissierella sp. P1]|uniref:hypothetical protein n=1 Tax=Tissierella TaxID=41273 RepID=UPI000BA0F4B6|nr:hypothetical protein [Tissierella sp. P1]MDU5080186.1 hypothetical protein [Bacillota bacterium]OZV13174.1 hypothetical protein CIW83_04665 [Tissierella sp. P1]